MRKKEICAKRTRAVNRGVTCQYVGTVLRFRSVARFYEVGFNRGCGNRADFASNFRYSTIKHSLWQLPARLTSKFFRSQERVQSADELNGHRNHWNLVAKRQLKRTSVRKDTIEKERRRQKERERRRQRDKRVRVRERDR